MADLCTTTFSLLLVTWDIVNIKISPRAEAPGLCCFLAVYADLLQCDDLLMQALPVYKANNARTLVK